MNTAETVKIDHGDSDPWGRLLIALLVVAGISYFIYKVLQPCFDCKTGEPLPVIARAWIFPAVLAFSAIGLICMVSFHIAGVAAMVQGDNVELTFHNAPFGNLVFEIPVSSIKRVGFALVEDGEGGKNSFSYVEIRGMGLISLPRWGRDDVDRLAACFQLPSPITEDTYPSKTLSYRQLKRLASTSALSTKRASI
jgi:hypothetical protein